MTLRDKAAKVDFGNLDDDATGTTPSSGLASPATGASSSDPTAKPRTTGVAGITERINLHHQVQELQAQVATFEKAQLVVKLDPRSVKQSRWKNRHELSYLTPEYAELKAEIEAAGGNVQPIKVRMPGKAGEGQDEYEIVYGRRRLRACLELGFEVSSIVEQMDDVALFKEMDRENRSREDLSPWEQGVMYKDALDGKLFASQRQMAAALNIPLGTLNGAILLASLPPEIIAAFPSPLELQYRWAAEINAALEKDTARVMTTARGLATREPKPSAKEVLAALVLPPVSGKSEPVSKQLKAGERVVGSFTKDARGGVSLKLKGGSLSAGNEKKLLEFVEKLLA